MSDERLELCNQSYRMQVHVESKQVYILLTDLLSGLVLADEPGIYRAAQPCEAGSMVCRGLQSPAIRREGDALQISGTLAGLTVRQTLTLPEDGAWLEEQLTLHNPTDEAISLEDLTIGFQRRIGTGYGSILPEVTQDRLAAIPLKHRATDPADFDADFALADLIARPGLEQRGTDRPRAFAHGHMPATQWAAEGWAWTHGEHTLVMMGFHQEAMQWATIAPEVYLGWLGLRFGGVSLVDGEPSALHCIQPGQTIELGATRYQTVVGGYTQAAYAYRAFLDAQGCRFPATYDPPVQWNELYDNPEWHLYRPGGEPTPRQTRHMTYTRELIEREAHKARIYNCEALYLDPGWDTEFGTFLWGEEWLGPRKPFIDGIRAKYGLKLALHCPLATWMSMDGRGVSSWPSEAFQMNAQGEIIEGAVCLGSRQYLAEAENRLLAHCRDGVAFLMFDGNWWNAGCWNPNHGHPVPYTKEDHARANLELARRIHRAYPDVLIEMHDAISGGAIQRYTPVYYKYGLPGSYDENWGMELMWQPMEDIRSGRGRSLYYYNLGCNVPLYLHIDLRDDNLHCLVLWWYASTCRHLGIGGTHSDPLVAHAQKLAMHKYHALQRFFKRGDFYGMHEGVHLHVLPDEGAFVINLFNLSDEERIVSGEISFQQLGLDAERWYAMPKEASFNRATGMLSVRRRMPAWSAEVLEVYSFK